MQFLVAAGHAPTTHRLFSHTSVAPGPGLGQLAAEHPAIAQPYVGSFTLTQTPPHSLKPALQVSSQAPVALQEGVPFDAEHGLHDGSPQPWATSVGTHASPHFLKPALHDARRHVPFEQR